MSLKKTEVKDTNGKTLYVSYTIEDLASITKWVGAGKSLLDEVATELLTINEQSKKLFDKQIEIANHYQNEINQLDVKLKESATNEAKLADTENKLDACNEQLIDKIKELEAKEKEVKEQQDEIDKLMSAHNYNNNNDGESQTILEEATNSYEKQLKELKEDLNQKARQIQMLQEKVDKTENSRNEIKQLADKLIGDLELANETIKERLVQNKDVIEIDKDEYSDLKKRMEALDKDTHRQIATINSKRPSSQMSASSESAKFKDDFDDKGIKIDMRTTLPTFSGRPDANPNIGDWLFQSKKIMDLARYTDSQMVAVGTNHLKDLAAQDYILHEKMYGIHKSWSEFAEFMTKRYTPANHNHIIRGKIKSLVQITSIKDYYNEFRMLALQATDMNEAEKLNAFVNGMKPDIRKYVNMQLPKSLENAYDTADLYETFNYERIESTYVSNQYSSNNGQKGKNNKNNNSNNYSSNNNNNSSNNSSNNNSSDRVLALHGVDYEQGFNRIQNVMQRLNFLHQGFVNA